MHDEKEMEILLADRIEDALAVTVPTLASRMHVVAGYPTPVFA